MKYGMQVWVTGPDGKTKQWGDVHPTGGKPYRFDSREEARRMLRICYPETDVDEARVVEVDEGERHENQWLFVSVWRDMVDIIPGGGEMEARVADYEDFLTGGELLPDSFELSCGIWWPMRNGAWLWEGAIVYDEGYTDGMQPPPRYEGTWRQLTQDEWYRLQGGAS